MAKRSHPITAYRKREEVSKAALARAAEISWRHLHRIERGEQSLTANVAKRIEKATKGALNAAELLGLAA